MSEEKKYGTLAEMFNGLDDNELGNDGDYSLIPQGLYDALIEKKTPRQNRKDNGSYLSTMFRIVGPSHIGAVVFYNITLENESARAKRIGLKKLKELCIAAGLDLQKDTIDDLIGKTVRIEVVQKETPDWGIRNEVIKVLAPETDNIPF